MPLPPRLSQPAPLSPPATVDEALSLARLLGIDRLDARVLLAHVVQRSSTWVHAHGDHALDTAAQAALCLAFTRRQQGAPVAYITGQREFFGLRLSITPDVLDPRPDTETLVQWALDTLVGELVDRPAPRVADLGTGSGAIALAVAQQCSRAELVATDISPQALATARRNGQDLGLPVSWREGRWLEPLAGETFDLILSNPPYLADDDPHLPALQAEPLGALVAGERGLADLHAIARQAPMHLVPGGWLLLEHGFDQAAAVGNALREAGFQAVQSRHDLAGHARCTGGRWGAQAGKR